MSRLDELPADQRAAVQLLLKQGKSYDELATLLRLDAAAVRTRALNALDALGAKDRAGLDGARRDELSDHLLRQQTPPQQAATRAFLAVSAPGRAWARAVAAQLQPLAGDPLPEIPDETTARAADTPAAAPAAQTPTAKTLEAPAPDRPEPSSQLGGILLLAGAAVVLVVIIVLAVSRLSGDDPPSRTTTAKAPATTAAETAPTTNPADAAPTTAPSAADPNAGVETRIAMKSATGGRAMASAFIVKQTSGRVLGIEGQDFPPSDASFNYAVWLYASPSQAVRLGFVNGGVKGSGADQGRLLTGADPDQIEADADALTNADAKAAAVRSAQDIRAALQRFYDYQQLIITHEKAGVDARTPGPIVVSGPIVRPR